MRRTVNLRNGQVGLDMYLMGSECEGEYIQFLECYSWNNIPYNTNGGYIDGDVKLVLHGTMKDFDELKIRGYSGSGRFPIHELIAISEHEANKLLREILSK